MSPVHRVGVVTVGYNSARHLPGFMRSLGAQHGVEPHLYFVDNASPDDGALIVEATGLASGPVTVVRNSDNVGVAAGNNAGIRAALADGHDWILLLNNDTEFDARFLRDLLDVAESEELPLLSPVISTDDDASSLWYGGGSIHPWQGFRVVHDGMYRHPAIERVIATASERTAYAPTCALLVRRDVFETVGLMDESFFVYSDDVDFSIRCTNAGFMTSITSRARMVHKDGGSTGGVSSDFSVWWLTRNWVLVARKHLPRPRMPLALLYMLVWVGGRFILRRDPWRQTRLRLAAMRAAFRIDTGDLSVPVDRRIPGRATRDNR